MPRKKCVFCNTTSRDEELGNFHKISVHNFHLHCLVFSSDIRQNADRTKGKNGFEKKNIDYTLNRAKNRSCSLCSKKGATVMCSGDGKSTCKATFHLTCALASKKTLHGYYDAFKSYCYEHISLECVFDFDPVTGISIKLDCCGVPLHSHDECILKYVLITKAQSKCPWCGNKNRFSRFMKENYTEGIPMHENASFATVNRPEDAVDLECAATRCKCVEKGLPGDRFRHEPIPNSPFELIACVYCGLDAIHRACRGIGINDRWVCEACHIEPNTPVAKKMETRTITRNLRSRQIPAIKKTIGYKNSQKSESYEIGYVLRNTRPSITDIRTTNIRRTRNKKS